MKNIIVIVGANGFLGRYLSDYYLAKGWEVRAIARREQGLAACVNYYHWDALNYQISWADAFDGATLVVNLAGRSVNCRYNQKNQDLIRDSRVQTTQLVGQAIANCVNPPSYWLNSSTATIYRHAQDKPQDDETGQLGSGFSVSVAKDWEQAFFTADTPEKTHRVALRTAIVMGNEKGTVIDVLNRLCRLYLGGSMGSGQQMVSWIHIEDFCRAIDWISQQQHPDSRYNLSAPNPLPNHEFMQLLRQNNHRKWGLKASKWMLELGAYVLRTETELILKSRWVLPSRLLSQGFEFNYEYFADALKSFKPKVQN